MRDRFPGFYPPSGNELDELWTTGTIVLDANTLLNLYRYTDETRQEFISVLQSSKERVWLPYQVGLEFQRNRLEVIDQQAAAYDSVIKALRNAESSISTELMRHKRHSSLPAQEMLEKYRAATEPISKDLEAARDQHCANAPQSPDSDSIWKTISELYEGRVGEQFSHDELEELFNEGKLRYADEIPPGYADKKKGEPGCYGDLVIWREILRHAAARSCSVIFVTDDGKEDWWRIAHGRTLGPRVELVEEFARETGGKRIHFYTPERFLRYANERLSAKVSDASLGEVERISTSQTDTYVRNVVLARRTDLMQRRTAIQRSLARLEENSERPERLQENQARAEGLLNTLSEFREQFALLQDIHHQTEQLLSVESDESARANLRTMDAGVLRNIETLAAEITKTEERLRAARRFIRAMELDDIGTSKPGRRDRLLARLEETEVALKEAERALVDLGGSTVVDVDADS